MKAWSRRLGLVTFAMVLGVVGWLIAGADLGAQSPTPPVSAAPRGGIWISPEEIRALPTRGPAWDALVAAAQRPTSNPDLGDQNDPSNVRVLAKALVSVRKGDAALALEVAEACKAIQGTEVYGNALAVGRELMPYVLAADIVGLDPSARAEFEQWLRTVTERSFHGRTIRRTHEVRPNNWGTHAGATRLAVAAYLADTEEIERAANVFQGWTGEPRGWRGFEFGAATWQPPERRRYAVNPRRATRDGHPIGGVLSDDQRRSGRFRWPPPKENYVYEALQGAVAQAVMLDRLGYDAWGWGDRALLRAVEWLHVEADFPAEGDDTWIPHIVNRAYGTSFPAPVPTRPGKGMGFSDWTHGPVQSERTEVAPDSG